MVKQRKLSFNFDKEYDLSEILDSKEFVLCGRLNKSYSYNGRLDASIFIIYETVKFDEAPDIVAIKFRDRAILIHEPTLKFIYSYSSENVINIAYESYGLTINTAIHHESLGGWYGHPLHMRDWYVDNDFNIETIRNKSKLPFIEFFLAIAALAFVSVAVLNIYEFIEGGI